MKIGIDNISPGESTTRRGPGGMRMYLVELLTEFVRRRPQTEFVILTPDWAEPLLDAPLENVRELKLRGVPTNRTRRTLYQQFEFARAISSAHLDVFFATATIAPLWTRVPVVLAVQFLQFYEMPEAYGRFRSNYLKWMLPLSVRKAKRIISFTEHAKRDLVHYTGADPNRVQVVPHGIAPDVWSAAQLPPDAPERAFGKELTQGRPYLLYVSATYGYKNHARLIQAFARVKREMNLPHVLLLVGAQVTVPFDELRRVAQEAGVSDAVAFAGRLDPHARAMYTHFAADLAVIPTLSETFGFPVLEAMALGCPVVTSNYGAMAELAGNAAILVDPLNPDAIADGICRVLADAVLRKDLIALGSARAREFTWANSASQTLAILESVAQNAGTSG